jgi:hypothetical protein
MWTWILKQRSKQFSVIDVPEEYPIRTHVFWILLLRPQEAVRWLVKFFRGDKAWVPMEFARRDIPLMLSNIR